MRLFVECKADEATVVALGAERRHVEHAAGRGRVCSQLSRSQNITGMMDEDPHAEPAPYMRALTQVSDEQGVRFCRDEQRHNRVIILSPRLEEWMVGCARAGGLRLTDFGFASDSGVLLHAEVNYRLESLQRLVQALLEIRNPGLVRLKSLILGKD